jgi:signal transduction histidine kinase
VRDAANRGYYPAAIGRVEDWVRERVRYHQDPRGLFEIELCDGRWLQIFERRTPSGGTVTINTDITAVKRRDEKLIQAQKLQALGQLTGGVAHDISNVLLLLECNLDLAVNAMRSGADPRSYLEGCETAMRLANTLNQRLLAVARQQPLQSGIVDVNALAQRMKDFLARTLPASIRIDTVLSPGLWNVLVDEGQLETAILNLCLNARDAMPEGGALRIETENRYLQEHWAQHEHELRPGSYVVVTVADSGAGMTREVARRAMEPFFTTKVGGKGSGLGLSTTYGFIKQSGGDMEIASRPGEGTEVRLFLPRVDIGIPADRSYKP